MNLFNMGKVEIYSELERVLKIVKSWKEQGRSTIEKDIVLEKLRDIYNAVKYDACEECKEETAGQAAEEAVAQVPAEEYKEPAVVETAETTEGEQGGYKEIQSGTEEPAVKPSETELFPLDEVNARPKLDKKVILSLYGEEEPVAQAEQSESVNNITAGKVKADEQPQGETVQDAANGNAKPVLGEVMGTNGETLADVYAKNSHNQDMATMISTENVSGLRSSIGINDKFLMVRDMFGGDNNAYEEAISDLERFGDLDEALLHIHETYSWNPNSDGVKFLIDLLAKKLS